MVTTEEAGTAPSHVQGAPEGPRCEGVTEPSPEAQLTDGAEGSLG